MAIILSEMDKAFISEIKERGGFDIHACVQCGKCAATCPLSLAGFPFYIKKLIHAIECGMREEIMEDSSMWACQSCNRCVEVCPQDVKPYEVLLALRRAAVRELSVPGNTIEGLRNLYKTGHAVYPKGYQARRKAVGLSEEPPSTLSFPEMLEQFQEFLRNSELNEVGLFPMKKEEKK
ncbi:MAG TPA: 4Fe-4S dicluster domain-containing protein [Dissulfurispiraceae bacterium]|nr:4Fe-4S dicluster domain-containing protein [Dissulfurispiraceae bacterium]